MANLRVNFSIAVHENKALFSLLCCLICFILWSGEVAADCTAGPYNLQPIQVWNTWAVKVDPLRLAVPDWSLFYISICNNTRSSISSNHCSADTNSICLLQGTNYTNIGSYNASGLNYTLSENGDGFRLDFKGDDCPDKANEKLQTSITFKCGTTMGLPVLIGKLGCTYFFEWHSSVACKNAKPDLNEVKCYIIDNNNKTRDLSPLIKTSGGYRVNSDIGDDIYINVCRDITPETDGPTQFCPPGSAACQLAVGDPNGDINIGKAKKHLIWLSDHHLQLRYENDVSPANGRCKGFKPKVTIAFVCPQDEGRLSGGRDPVLLSSTNCQYDIEWQTEYACDAAILSSTQCKLNNDIHGVDIDLTPLKKEPTEDPYSAEDKDGDYTYYMNVCDNMPVSKCGGKAAGVCQEYPRESPTNSVVAGQGDANHMKLRYADGEITLTYEEGDTCNHNGFHRTSIISFECNKTAVDDGKGVPEYVGETECNYFFEWETKYACMEHPAQTTCTVSNEFRRFDLSPLVRAAGNNWQALDGRHDHTNDREVGHYFINICADILTESPATSYCPPGSAACFLSDQGDSAINLGEYSQSPVLDAHGDIITLTYTDGDTCDGDKKRSTVITFICAPGDLESAPSLVRKSEDKCLYEFEWRTAAACPLGRKFGPDCTVFDDDAGVSFDLNPLKKTTGSYQATISKISDDPADSTTAPYDFYLNVCGKVDGTKCNETSTSTIPGPGACQQEATGDAKWIIGQANNTLEYYDGVLKLTYDNGEKYHTTPPKFRKTEIAFLCDPDIDVGNPEYQQEGNNTYFFKWHTKYACPAQPIECIVTDESTHEQYDLSSLSKALEEDNWSFVDDATDTSIRTKYYINVCRPINPVRGCAPYASVCQARFEKDEETISIPNLGVPKGRPVLESPGHIKIKYINGSKCTINGKQQRIESHVHFSCRKGQLGSSPRLLEKVNNCEYSFIWETEAACAIDSATGDECSVKDPNSEYWFNLEPLSKTSGSYDVKSADETMQFQLNICGGIEGDSQCEDGTSVCLVKDEIPVQIGKVSNTPEFSDDGLLTLKYAGEFDKKSAETYTTEITFLCRHDVPHDQQGPEFVRVESLNYIFNFETPLACLPESVDCLVSDMAGNQYDLSPLAKDSGNWEAVDTREGYEHLSYHINVCRPVNALNSNGSSDSETVTCAGGPIGACQTDTKNSKTFNMGYVQAMPEAGLDGSLSIRYVNGDKCHNGTYHRSTRINFECSSTPGSPVFQTETQECEYIFTWETPAACAMKRVTGAECKVQVEQFDFQFDLSPLHNQEKDYLVPTRNYNYTINVCGPLVDGTGECASSDNVASCQINKDGGVVAQAGVANGDLVYDEGVLRLNYTDGKLCHQVYERSTAINFFCDDTITEGNGVPTYINETEDCTYQFEWPTPLACPPFKVIECSYRHDQEQYDLAPMAGIEDNYRVTSNSIDKRGVYYINICRSLLHKKGVQGSQCPHNAAACMEVTEGETKRYDSLGEVDQGPTMKNGHLVLKYDGGDTCPDGVSKKSTEISIECDKNAVGGLPQFSYASDNCNYYFTWFSNLACDIANDNQEVSGDCTATNPATGHIFDLSSLKEAKGYGVKGKDGHMYTINICAPVKGTVCTEEGVGACQESLRTIGTSHSYNAGKFNQRLSYDDQILSLVYEDGTKCHGGKFSRSTVINFVCPQVEDDPGKPVFIDESDDCTYFFSWHTPLACEHFTQCTVTNGSQTIDLSRLANSQGYFLATSLDDSTPTPFYINLCHPLSPIPGIRCPPNAAACKVENNKWTSLGRVDQGPQIGDNGKSVNITYTNGDECPEDSSRKITSIIKLQCAKGLSSSSPVMTSYSDCTYHFEWQTNTVCPPSKPTDGKDCKYYNDVIGYEFDLNRLTEKQYSQMVPGSGQYFLHLCKAVESGKGKGECDGAAVCKKEGSEYKSLGSLASQQFVYEGGQLHVTYSDGSSCGHDDNEKRQTTIIFKCAENNNEEQHEPAFFSVDRKCNYVFQWSTSLACPPMTMPCDLSYYGNIFDLQPLSQITGSWQFKDSQKNTYYMNLCQPAYNTPEDCPKEAAVCRERPDGTLDTLGMIYTQQLRAYGDASSTDIILKLADGDPDACMDDPTTSTEVQIIFKCSQKVGQPKFHNQTVTEGKACRFTFLWESKVACPEERVPVTLKKGKLKDPETDKAVDLNPLIKHGSWVVEGDTRDEKTGTTSVYRYYINLGDKVQPIDGDKDKVCKKSAVCQTKAKDKTFYRGVGDVDSKQYFIEGEIIEIEIISPNSCGQKDTRDVVSTIVLQCDPNGKLGEPKFLYESANCQYYFEWVTSAACDSAQAVQPKAPSGGGGGGAGGGGTENSKHTEVSTVIGVLAGIVLICVLVIVFHKKERRSAVYWKIRSCLPGAYNNVPAYSYAQLSSGDSEENLIGLNSTRGLFNSDDEEDEELLKDTRTNPHEFHDDSDEEILPNV